MWVRQSSLESFSLRICEKHLTLILILLAKDCRLLRVQNMEAKRLEFACDIGQSLKNSEPQFLYHEIGIVKS